MLKPLFARDPIERRVRAEAGRQGRRLSRALTISRRDYGIVVAHPLKTAVVDPALDAPGDDALMRHALEVDALGRHGRAWNAELRRRGVDPDEAPDGSRIAHPLVVRLMMEDGVPRGAGPSSWEAGRPSLGRLRDFHWVENRCGAWIAQRMMAETATGRLVAYAAIDPDRAPRIRVGIRMALSESGGTPAGRPLSDVLPLDATGDAEIDAAYASLLVDEADLRPDAATLTLVPARWIGWTGDPSWAEWHAFHPYFS